MKNYQDLARSLQADAPELDELKRARLEKDFLQRVAAQDAKAPAHPSNGRTGAIRMAIGVAAGVLLVVGFQSLSASWGSEPSSATVIALRDGVPVREAALESGETVVTSEGQLLRVRFGVAANTEPSTLVEVAAESRATFVQVDGTDHRLVLERGQVRVEFHPPVRGEESLWVQTGDARVLVVGTVFEVTVTEDGTQVSVEEGAVRVEPLVGEPFVVSAGASRRVPRQVRPEQGEQGEQSESESGVDPGADETAEGTSPALVAPERFAENEAPALMLAGSTTRRRRNMDVDTAVGAELGGTEADNTETTESPRERIENALDRARGGGSAPTPLEDDVRFDLARRYFDANRLDQARHELYAIARTTDSRRARARAWTVVAETFEREADPIRAVEAYRRAARVSGTAEAADAMFALARIRVSTGDSAGGRATYEEYLQIAPNGPLASAARRALCRLGDAQYCP